MIFNITRIYKNIELKVRIFMHVICEFKYLYINIYPISLIDFSSYSVRPVLSSISSPSSAPPFPPPPPPSVKAVPSSLIFRHRNYKSATGTIISPPEQ